MSDDPNEALAKAGLHFDELNKIRVLDPDVALQTNELKDECKDFLDSKSEFVFTKCSVNPQPYTQQSNLLVLRSRFIRQQYTKIQ